MLEYYFILHVPSRRACSTIVNKVQTTDRVNACQKNKSGVLTDILH